MSIFPNYSKPGPGVSKEDNRSRIGKFFDIYTRKFSKFVGLNLLNLVFNIPAIFIAYIFSNYFIFIDNSKLQSLNFPIIYIVISLLVCIPVITVGPLQAGYTYILRNYAREEHSFIWDDFKEHSKKNWKQGLIVTLIDIIVVYILIIEIKYFWGRSGILSNVTCWLNIFVFVVYSIMHMYIYQMMVTINLTVVQLYKNALIFALMNILKNLLVYFICVVLICLLSIIPFIGIVAFVFISISTIGFIINYHAYSTVKKYLIDPVKNKENELNDKDKNMKSVIENDESNGSENLELSTDDKA